MQTSGACAMFNLMSTSVPVPVWWKSAHDTLVQFPVYSQSLLTWVPHSLRDRLVTQKYVLVHVHWNGGQHSLVAVLLLILCMIDKPARRSQLYWRLYGLTEIWPSVAYVAASHSCCGLLTNEYRSANHKHGHSFIDECRNSWKSKSAHFLFGSDAPPLDTLSSPETVVLILLHEILSDYVQLHNPTTERGFSCQVRGLVHSHCVR